MRKYAGFQRNLKGEIVVTETFQSEDTDFQVAQNQRLLDAIVLPGYYTETGKTNRCGGIKQPITGGWI